MKAPRIRQACIALDEIEWDEIEAIRAGIEKREGVPVSMGAVARKLIRDALAARRAVRDVGSFARQFHASLNPPKKKARRRAP